MVSDRSSIKAIVPVYPGLNATTDSPEAHEVGYVNGFLPITEVAWMRQLYQGGETIDPKIRYNYFFSPSFTPDNILSVFPPSYFVFAKYDILTQEGVEFVDRLKSLHVPTEMKIYRTTIHTFFGRDHFATGHEALTEAAKFLKTTFSSK